VYSVFEIWCCRKIENIIWTDLVRTKLVHGVKAERNIVRTINRRESDWIGHIWHRNCLLKDFIIEGKIEGRI